MRPSRSVVLPCLALLGACAPEGPQRDRLPPQEPAPSEVLVRAVDANTGGDLRDPELTLRYLVRAPVTLDAAGVERVPSHEPHRFAQAVGEDSLVLELRLEAPSYHQLDTVVSVARGSTAGPFRLAMAPRTDRGTETTPPGQPNPQPTGGAEDRSGLLAGDRAFELGNWGEAASRYASMDPPRNRGGAYAREYQLALVRKGISHINLGEWQAARQALEEAVAFDFREYTAFFYLGQVQCALQDYEAGRQSVSHVRDWLTLHISEAQRPIVDALIDYQLAMCSYGEFTTARLQADMQRARQRALGEFRAFLDKAEAFPAMPPEIQAAVRQARTVMAEMGGRTLPPAPAP